MDNNHRTATHCQGKPKSLSSVAFYTTMVRIHLYRLCYFLADIDECRARAMAFASLSRVKEALSAEKEFLTSLNNVSEERLVSV